MRGDCQVNWTTEVDLGWCFPRELDCWYPDWNGPQRTISKQIHISLCPTDLSFLYLGWGGGLQGKSRPLRTLIGVRFKNLSLQHILIIFLRLLSFPKVSDLWKRISDVPGWLSPVLELREGVGPTGHR